MVKVVISIVCIFVSVYSLEAQSAYSLVKKGNKELEKERYIEAEVQYRKAIEKSPKAAIPSYNIGVSKYEQGNMQEAQTVFAESAEKFDSKKDKAHSYHNLGNAHLKNKEYEKSIVAYKEALKLIPDDMDTKYNLAYAQHMLKKEQEKENQDQDNDKQENKENQDKQDNNNNNNNNDKNKENKQNKDNSDQENKGEDEKDENNNKGDEEKNEDGNNKEEKKDNAENGEDNNRDNNDKPKQLPKGTLSKEQAEQLLRALENQEGKLQEKLDKPEGDPVNVNIENDW